MRRIRLRTYLKREAARLAKRDGEPFSTALTLSAAEKGNIRCFYPLLLLKICEGGSRAEKLMGKVSKENLKKEGFQAMALLDGIEDIEAMVLAKEAPCELPREFSKHFDIWLSLYHEPETHRKTKSGIAARIRKAVGEGRATGAQIATACDIDPGNLSAFMRGELNRLSRDKAREVLKWLGRNGFANGPLRG